MAPFHCHQRFQNPLLELSQRMMNMTGHWSVVLIKVGDRDSLKLRAMTVKGRREGGREGIRAASGAGGRCCHN